MPNPPSLAQGANHTENAAPAWSLHPSTRLEPMEIKEEGWKFNKATLALHGVMSVEIVGHSNVEGDPHRDAGWPILACHEVEPLAHRILAILNLFEGIPTESIATATVIFNNGDKRCGVEAGFTNLQECPAGFGDTDEEAVQSLKSELMAVAG